MPASKRRGWVASLNDGTTLFEESETSWRELVKKCQAGSCSVTQVRLQYAGVTIIAAKDKGHGVVQYADVRINPKTGAKIPVRALGTVIDDQIFLTVIDDSRNVWQEIVPYTLDWDDKIVFILRNSLPKPQDGYASIR